MKPFKTLLKPLVSAGLLYVLYRKLDVAALGVRFAALDLPWLALGFLFLFLNTFISSLKWRTLLRADGIRQPLWSLFASHLVGSFFSLFLPSTIGGDAYRIADIGSRTSKAARTAASVLADRLTGFLALAVYGLAASFAVRRHVPNWDDKFLLLPAVALAAILAIGAALCSPRLVQRCCRLVPGAKLRTRALGAADQVLGAMRAYFARPSTGAKALLLSFLFQFDVILFVWSVTKAVGLSIPFGTFFLFVPFITLMEMLPVSIFGLGLRDLGYAWFMGAVGSAAAKDDAAAVSIVYVALTILYVAIGGVLFVFRRQRGREAP